MRRRTGFLWALAGIAAVAGIAAAGCESQPPDTERIARAIAASDSLRQGWKHRQPQSWEGYPVATTGDSDSVTWLHASPETTYNLHEVH